METTDFAEDLEKCLEVLHNGGTILYPTDTIWGLGCDATNEQAVKKLMQLKGKPEGRGLIILLATERDIFKHVAAPDPAVFDHLQQARKPLTMIYENGLGVAESVLNLDGSIAIRLVREDFCRHLVKRFKKPVVSTSANVHGQASPQNFKDVSTEILDGVEYVVNFRQHDDFSGRASTIEKWKGGTPVTIRE